jgi:hypothetical protein
VSTMADEAPSPAVPFDPAWPKIGRVAGYLGGITLLVASILQALAELELLGSTPEFHQTSAGPLQDIANYYADFFNYSHRILWNIAIRDTLFPIAFMTFIVIGLAIRHIVGAHKADAQLMSTFFLVGGILVCLDPLTYLSQTNWWRSGGWVANPPENMVAIGRAAEAIDNLTNFFQIAGLLALSVALFFLFRVCRREAALSPWLGTLALVLAIGIALGAVSSIIQADTIYKITLVSFGIVLGPLLLIGLGLRLGSGWAASSTAVSEV